MPRTDALVALMGISMLAPSTDAVASEQPAASKDAPADGAQRSDGLTILALQMDLQAATSSTAGWSGTASAAQDALARFGSHNPHLDIAGSGRREDACVFCHTPNGGGEAGLGGAPVAVFAMYSSPTMDMPGALVPGAQTTLCLSCHDGSSAHDSMVGGAGPGLLDGVLPEWLSALAAPAGAGRGRDPRGEHPVAIHYLDGRDSDLRPRGMVEASGLPFYGQGKDQLECTTCHDPHSNREPPYLRMSNSRSRLCLTCHDK